MFHQIPELTKDGDGYVYWKGGHVEHYSFHGDDARAQEAEAARELRDRCLHLEALGLPVSAGTAIWSWPWFEGLTPASLAALPLLVRELITTHRDLYEDDRGRFCWIADHAPEPKEYPHTHVLTIRVFDHGSITSFTLNSDEMGGHYHPLRAAGWNIAQMGQGKDAGCCYATTEQVLAWMRAKGAM